LNPLGDESSMLDTLLTTPVDGEEFVRARMLSGLILGVPVVVVGNFIAEPFNPFSPLTSLVVTVFGVLLCLYTAALGVGIGSFAPRFQPVRSRTFDDVEVVRPTIVALLGYTFVSLLAAVLGLLVFGFPEVLGLLPYVGDLPTLWVRVGGAAVLVAVLGVVGYRSYVYAVERFNRYTV
ncbi:MAG: hypothetical protein SV760_10435, partial [Halobacteria archaeon]|nr:hypothetical protein [Halobacteria archaeon]